MRRFLAAFAVCAALATAQQATPACLSDDIVTVCMQFGDDWVKESLDKCLADSTPGKTSGKAESTKVALTFQVNNTTRNAFAFAPQFVKLTCAKAPSVAVFNVTHAISPASLGLPDFVSSLEMEVSFRVEQALDGSTLSLAWAGDLFSGALDSIFVEFAVHKAAYDGAIRPSLSFTPPPVSGTSRPALPPQLSFLGTAFLDLLEGAGSCPLSDLGSSLEGGISFVPTVTIPGTGVEIALTGGEFDPCAALAVAGNTCADCELQVPFLALTAQTVDPVAFKGTVLQELVIHVEANFSREFDDAVNETVETDVGLLDEDEPVVVVELKNMVAWKGSVAAAIELMPGTFAQASATFSSDEGITDLQAVLAIDTEMVQVSGTVDWVSDCPTAAETQANLLPSVLDSNENRGAVTVVFPTLNATVEATAQQLTCETWHVTGGLLSDNFRLFGVQVTKAFADLHVTGDKLHNVSGTVGGSVNVAGMIGASGVASFEQGAFTGLTLDGVIELGSVLTGSATFVTTNWSAETNGTGDITLTFGNGGLSLFADIVYRKDAGLDEVVWEVHGGMPAFELYSIAVSDVTVAVTATRTLRGLQWAGVVAGQIELDGFAVAVEIEIANNAFQAIAGELTVEAPGLAFAGFFELDETSKSEGCAGPTYAAGGTLEVGKYVFEGALTVDGCAVPGSVKKTIAAAMEGDASVKLGNLALNRASMDVAGTLGADGKIASWSGQMTANANLFGGTSTASVAFANGAFGEVFVSTFFRTESQLLSGSLEVTYTPNCNVMSTGNAALQVRLQEADTLDVAGSVEYNACSGELHFDGEFAGGWVPPGQSAPMLVRVQADLPANASAAKSGIGSRRWTGSITASAQGGNLGAGLTISFDSATSATNVAATLAYETDNLYIGAEFAASSSGPCSGEGTVIVRNLPHGIPNLEGTVAAALESCGAPAENWEVTGAFGDFVIPFGSKSLSLRDVTVVASRQAATDPVTVAISGSFAGKYVVSVTFDSTGTDSLRVNGKTPDSAGRSSVADFLAGFSSGAQVLPSSLGVAAPGLLDGLKGLGLDAVNFGLDFSEKRVVLEGTGPLFGVDWYALVFVQKRGKAWAFGILVELTSDGFPAGLPGLLEKALENVGTGALTFSVGSLSIPRTGVVVPTQLAPSGVERVVRPGLALEARMSPDNELAQQASGSGSELGSAVENGKDGGGGLVVRANLASPKDMDVFIDLQGDIELGSRRMKIVTLALNFQISVSGPPKVGFLVSMQVALGEGERQQDLTVSGFIALAATGSLTLALDADSPEPWEFFPGVAVLFPVGLRITISPALVPTAFGVVGGVEVAGARGELALGVDLENLAKTAFRVNIENVNLKRMIVELTGCAKCVKGVGQVLERFSVGKIEASINPDPVNPVELRFAASSTTIEAGVHLFIEDMTFFGVITVREARLDLDASGLAVFLEVAPVKWGPLEITAASDHSKGPVLDLALTTDRQHLIIDGRARILGLEVALQLELSDAKMRGDLEVSIGPYFGISGYIESTGRPGSSGFVTTVSAELKLDMEKFVEDATAFLRDLQAAAQKKFDDAKKKLDAVNRDLARAKEKLRAKERSFNRKVDGWERKLGGLDKNIASTSKKCSSYRRSCRKWRFRKCFAYAGCKIKLAALKVARGAAKLGLNAVRAAARAAFGLARGAVTASQGLVTAAKGVVTVAQKAVNGFLELAIKAGGLLAKVLQINRLGFTTKLSSSSIKVNLFGDIRVLGLRVQWDFTAELDFKKIALAVGKKLREMLKKKIRLPGL